MVDSNELQGRDSPQSPAGVGFVQQPQIAELEALASAAEKKGDWPSAVRYWTSAVARSSDARYQYRLGVAFHASGQARRSVVHYRRYFSRRRANETELYNYATSLMEIGDWKNSARHFKFCIKNISTSNILAYLNYGRVLVELGQHEEAERAYSRAISINPNLPAAYSNLALLFDKMGRLGDALLHAGAAVAKAPTQPALHTNLGYLCRRACDWDAAEQHLKHALTLHPNYVPALLNLATLERLRANLLRSREWAERAVQYSRGTIDALAELGETCLAAGDYRQAWNCFSRIRLHQPNNVTALLGIRKMQMEWCDWSEPTGRELVRAARSGSGEIPVLHLLLETDDPQLLARAAAGCVARRGSLGARKTGARAGGHKPRSLVTHKAIRIGYVSGDFRAHAGATLCPRVFELHDRGRFSVFGYSLGPDDGSAMRRRIEQGVDVFRDLSSISDADAAKIIQTDEIDVLVCRDTHNLFMRLGIFALRPATVQVAWLGYPGTSGDPSIDYIIADRIVAPPRSHPFFSEKIVRLPFSYQANDDLRQRADHLDPPLEFDRETGIRFGCFNNPAKINADIFADWMQILCSTPNSSLTLIAPLQETRHNLAKEARRWGVNPNRLIFLDRAPFSEHLRRYSSIDMFLDTFPYGGHTILSEALWQGCPCVSRLGRSFQSRVGGSLLTAVGLPAMAVRSRAEYINLAVALGNAPERLREIRHFLTRHAPQSPLFNSQHYTRYLERSYDVMLARARRGEPPVEFDVHADPDLPELTHVTRF